MNEDIKKEIEYYYYRHPDPMIEYLIRQAMWELEEVHLAPEEEYEWEEEPEEDFWPTWLNEEPEDDLLPTWLNEEPEDDLWMNDLQ
jgi:hypothetical protein